MGTFWININILVFSLASLVSVVVVTAYIPVKKSPAVLKTNLIRYTQKFYVLLVASLFSALLSFGLYIAFTYNLLVVKDPNEIARVVLMTIFIVSLLVTLISFKKQKLSDFKIFLHLFFSSLVIVIVSSDDVFYYPRYGYLLLVLALFAIVRYGVRIINKQF